MTDTTPLTPEALRAIDDTLGRTVTERETPGAAWGVIADGRLVHVAGAGTTSIDGGSTPGERTLFRIASMTKSFTAAAVLALRDDGALRLDDPVADHLPEAAGLRGPTADSPAITVRHLLSMGSGLPSDDPWADRHLDMSEAELTRAIAHGAWFAWPTDAACQYSNLGYAVLGRLVAAATGRTCQDEITARFLDPLGLGDTVWTPRPDQRDRAIGHRRVDDAWIADEPAPLGDGAFAAMGGLWSTVADVARWVAFLLDAYPARDDPDHGALCRASRREMQQVWRADHLGATACPTCDTLRVAADGYAAGLRVIRDLHVGTVVSHSGGVPGFGSNMRWLPDRGLGVVALGNATYAPMGAANRAALDALAHGSLLPPTRLVPPPAPLVQAVHALVALLNDWDDGQAASLFCDNVALDEPYDRRRAAAGALVARLGRLEVGRITAEHRADATAVLRGERGEAELLVQLHPLLPPLVQWYETT